MIIQITLAILVAIVVVFFFLFFLKKRVLNLLNDLMGKVIDENLKQTEIKSREVFREERERIMEQYRSEKEIISEKMKAGQQDLDSKKDAIKEMINKISEDLQKNQSRMGETEKDRIREFNTLKTVIEEHKNITGGLKESADHLKNILSNNQLRGKYGEEIAENLLKSVGFVKGQHYSVNVAQETVSTRPDFTMYLPDKTKINIDAKFPLQSLIKYQETEIKQEKERYLREFTSDVKQKIKQVTTRDYINPEENTVDFVILFVPNEMIFSFIYDRLHEVWNDAMKKKVIMAGPFSFTAILRMVFQSYKNFAYQQNLHSIIKLINTFASEYENFSAELDKLGTRINAVETQYNAVSVTRAKKLTGVLEKIKNEDILLETKSNELID
ncbi:MAG: DNA recombination protein RmuC [Parcubacteria group bacterium]|jgi:DNA recombination protein RmuC